MANAGRADAALAAIVAGGWSDAARVGQRAAELLGQEALGTQGAAPPAVVCAGGTLEPTPAERAAALYEGVEHPLTADDVALVIAQSLALPGHINLDEITMRPVAQAAQHKLIRGPLRPREAPGE